MAKSLVKAKEKTTVKVVPQKIEDKKVFLEGSKVWKIEQALNPDPNTGFSDYKTFKELSDIVGFALNGNGAAHIQDDRGLGTKYELSKLYGENGKKELLAVRTIGFTNNVTYNKIPKKARINLTNKPCAFCGTHNNLEIDHKNGRKDTDSTKIKDFQSLCTHCNKIKRERCKACKKTGVRFDAKTLGYNISYIKGTKYYNPMYEGCEGCYLYDVEAFRKFINKK